MIRDKTIGMEDFREQIDRLATLLVMDAMNFLDYDEKGVTTPTGSTYAGLSEPKPVCFIADHLYCCLFCILRCFFY
jgi:uracil phosphoribosyltransferase